MPTWFILVAIIAVCLTVLLYVKGEKSVETFGDFKDQQMNFANRQYTYFHDTAGKGILTNPGLNLNGLNDAMKQPDLYLPKSPDRDYTSYFMEDPENAYSSKDAEFCKKAIHPRDLPRREPKSKVACSWYYVNDPSTPSVGAIGTRDGPIFAGSLPANGEWIWDIPTAIMKEDIKACKRVKSCDLMNVDGVHGKCGFCERLGYAVPINFDGSEKYPASEEACGQYTIRDANQCYKPKPKSVTTSDGVSCGTLGRPSPDNSMRHYNKDECDKLNGQYYSSGECLKKSGNGSYSYDCRSLNNPPAAATKAAAVAANVCTPATNGRLSRACLQSLASGLGYAKQGGVLRILASGGSPNDKERMAIDQLKSAGYAVPDAILGNGDIDSQSAANLYQKIFDATARGTTNLSRQAAQLLVTGNDSFDVCAFDSEQDGPFPAACLQRAFRMAGCQASGLKNPSEATAGNYASKKWGEVTGEFATLYKAMKSSNAKEQDAAVKDCLGITYARPDPVRCDYKQTLGGYDEGSGAGQICFNTTLKEAKDQCAAMTNCKSFSFANQPNLTDSSTGFGCFKMDKVGFANTGAYTGFTKLDQPLNDYSFKGCYADTWNRALPVYAGNGKTFDTCKAEAEKRGINTFALQYYGECWLGNNADYAKYGPAGGCGDRGGAWSQNVYKKNSMVDLDDFSSVPLTLNGYSFKPKTEGKTLQLSSAGSFGNSTSVFMIDKVLITNFQTSFTVNFKNNRADGMTFCIQNKAPNALGGAGGGLGVHGITPGAAIRIDNYYGPDGRLSVGFIPTNSAISSSGGGYNDLAESGDITGLMGLPVSGEWMLDVEIKYFNGKLSYMVRNTNNPNGVFSRVISTNLTSLVGGEKAWVGFTSGTGGLTNDIFITNWKMGDASPPEKWAQMGWEGETVNVAQDTKVRYGANGKFAEKTMSGNVGINNGTFGDPIYGTRKKLDAFI